MITHLRFLKKGTVGLGNKDASIRNVLLIENMKHNLLSVGHMYDQGNILIFISKYCEIRKEASNRLVATMARTPNNVYILNDIGK